VTMVSRVRHARDEPTPTHPDDPPGAVEPARESPAPAPLTAVIVPVVPPVVDPVVDPVSRLIRLTPPAMTPMPPVPFGEYDSTEVRRARRHALSERRARYRSRWWFPLLIVGMVVTGFWGALKVDQRVAEELVWPSHGARFVEVSSSIDTPSRPGGRLTIVVGGLNRTSGTGVALALLPSLEANGSRVFSLVYGSGINDQDIREKFDALVADTKPREVSFFGSSMGGDVVLNMAAHAQQNRDQYVQDELLGGTALPDAVPSAGPAALHGSSAPAAQPTETVGGKPLVSGTGAITDALVPAAPTDTRTGLIGRLPVPAIDVPNPAAGPITGSNTGSNTGGKPGGSTSAGTGPSAGGTADRATTVSGSQTPVTLPPPRIGTIFLDCTPLGTDDVRDAGRTQADVLTGLTEAIGTDGGAVTRLAAEMLVQRPQWASGRFPFLQVRWDDFDYKFDQVMREKIGGAGVSTQLIKDQYGVIRRLDMDDIASRLAPGTRIVYFLPATPTDDHTVRVEKVQTELQTWQTTAGLNVRFEHIPGGHHASAESNPDSYRLGIEAAADIGP